MPAAKGSARTPLGPKTNNLPDIILVLENVDMALKLSFTANGIVHKLRYHFFYLLRRPPPFPHVFIFQVLNLRCFNVSYKRHVGLILSLVLCFGDSGYIVPPHLKIFMIHINVFLRGENTFWLIFRLCSRLPVWWFKQSAWRSERRRRRDFKNNFEIFCSECFKPVPW